MKEMVRIVDNSKPRKTVEEKQYLICLSGMGQDDWIIVEGRTEAYEYIESDREEEFRASNIDSSINVDSDERLDMASFMDGTITTENL